jgi:tetratricopeptide (TPR) repeat protein
LDAEPFAAILPAEEKRPPTVRGAVPEELIAQSRGDPAGPAVDPFAAIEFGSPPSIPPDLPAPGAAGSELGVPSPASGGAASDLFADFGSPAPNPRAAPLGFGEVDLGEFDPSAPAIAGPPRLEAAPLNEPGGAPASPEQAPGGEPVGDGREFDPGRAVHDALGADLAEAPRASPQQESDASELELLDFIDDAGAAGKKVRPSSLRFQIRRKSGKVFGPFDQPTVVKMLADGQLLGNEDVSSDGEQWAPVGSVPAFAEAIQKLMESPATLQVGAGPEEPPRAGGAPASGAEALERMRALYGDRMAAIAVVDSATAERKLRKLAPLAAAVVAALVLMGAGIYSGQTPYGYFGVRWLFPSHLKKGSASYQKYVEAEKALAADTFESYSQALAGAKSLLAENGSAVEARSLYAQATFYLGRRFFRADAELVQARRYLEELELSSKAAPETIKARAGQSLSIGQPAQVRPALEAAIAKNPDDLELKFLLAEGHLQQRAAGPAAEVLKKVLAADPNSPKALHALGVARTLESPPDWTAAQALFQKALEAGPRHVSSAVEIAAILVHRLEKAEEAVPYLERALSEDAEKQLAPSELARAHSLMGKVQASRHQGEAARQEFEAALKIFPESAPARAAYGRFLLARREYEKALALFEGAHKADPKDVDYLDGLIRSMLGASKLHTAAKLLGEAPSELLGDPRLTYLKGRAAEEADKGEEAESQYRRAAAADPKYWEPSLALGRFYLGRRRFPEAKRALADALQRGPGVAEVHVGQGDWHLEQADIGEAKKEYLAALAIDREAAAAHLGMAQALLAEGALDGAQREFELAVSLDPAMPRIFTKQAALLMQRGDWGAAAATLEKAKNADPKDAVALWRLGAVELERGKLAEAMNNLNLSLTLDPSGPDAHYYKARVHHVRHENTQALDAMKTALAHAERRPDLHFWMGNILFQSNRFDEAVEHWQEAVKLKPDYADALEALARGYQERQVFDQAIGFYEQVMKVDPSRKRLLMSVADCKAGMNRYDEAIAKYREALKADRSLVGAYFRIGRCYTEKSKINEAIEWYQKAAAGDPDAKEVWRFLGYAYKEKGRKKEAIGAFEKYLALNKDAGDAKDIANEIFDLKSER